MKVLVIHCAYQYKGGEDTVVEEEIKLLKQAGVEVSLLTFSNGGTTVLNVLQMPFNLSSYRKVTQKLKSFCPDVVHVHNVHFAASPSVIYAAKKQGVPVVCTLHNFRLLCPSATLFDRGELFLTSLRQAFPFEAVKRGVYKNSKLLTFWLALSMQLHRWWGTWKIPERFIVLTQHAKDIFLQSNAGLKAEQVVVKPNFCSLPVSDQTIRGAGFVYIGRLSPEKGVPLLLKVFASSPHKVVIAGDGPLKEEVMAAAEKHPNISYAGALQKEDVQKLMKSATAMVFPSVWFEGMPLTIIEAFACGTPVIASKTGAMKYMITPGHDGCFFEAGDEQGLHHALDVWSNKPVQEKERFSANAFTTYGQFYTPQKNVDQLLRIYSSVQPAYRQSKKGIAMVAREELPPAFQTL